MHHTFFMLVRHCVHPLQGQYICCVFAQLLTSVTTENQPPSPGPCLPAQVLLTSAGRLRVGALGIPETLSLDPPESEDVAQLQRDDLTALGNLLLALACAGLTAMPSVEVVAAHCSAELTRVVLGLVAGGGGALSYVLVWFWCVDVWVFKNTKKHTLTLLQINAIMSKPVVVTTDLIQQAMA